jgi:hypothetical protein
MWRVCGRYRMRGQRGDRKTYRQKKTEPGEVGIPLATEETDLVLQRTLARDRFVLPVYIYVCMCPCMPNPSCVSEGAVQQDRESERVAFICMYAHRVVIETLHFTNGVQKLQGVLQCENCDGGVLAICVVAIQYRCATIEVCGRNVWLRCPSVLWLERVYQ